MEDEVLSLSLSLSLIYTVQYSTLILREADIQLCFTSRVEITIPINYSASYIMSLSTFNKFYTCLVPWQILHLSSR